jgi:HD-GYP domain-containing protein (c-di-GMP phosphodiesterase class II)
VREIVDDIIGDRSIVYNLNWMKGMDEYTFVHALHISVLAIELGRDIGLPRERLEELGTATLLHDIGKIFVPLEILRKPTKLDAGEFEIINRHPVDGALVLAREPDLPPVAGVVAFEHHVHLDRSGYPKVRRNRELNAYSLMTSVVDVYDALTTMRPYRPPLPPHMAVAVMREQYEGRLEPRLLARFLELLGPHPWGSLLRLPEGRLAVISRPNPADPSNPLARIIEMGAGGAEVLDGESHLRDLTRRPEHATAVDPLELGIDLTSLLHRGHAAASAQRTTAP